MPWIAVALFAILSNAYQICGYEYSARLLQLPLAIFLGRRYGEAGVIVTAIGGVFLLIDFPALLQASGLAENTVLLDNISALLNSSWYLLLLCMATLAWLRPNFMSLNNHDQLKSLKLPHGALMLFLPLAIFVPGLQAYLGGLNFYWLITVWGFALGLYTKKPISRYVFWLSVFMLLVIAVGGARNEAIDSMASIGISYWFADIATLLDFYLSAKLGRIIADAQQDKERRYDVSAMLVAFALVMVMPLKIWFESEAVDSYLLWPDWVNIAAVLVLYFYWGRKAYFLLPIGLLLSFLWPGEGARELVLGNNLGELTVDVLPKFATLTMVVISVIHAELMRLILNATPKQNFDFGNWIFLCRDARRLRALHRFSIGILPMALLFAGLAVILDNLKYSQDILLQFEEFYRGGGLVTALSIVVFSGFIYLGIQYLPIVLATEIVRRNGVAFTDENFPEYRLIHQEMDAIYGSERTPLYLVSEQYFVRTTLAKRIYKTYDMMHPVLVTSSINAVRDKPDQLRFMLHHQHGKVAMRHTHLWWYLFPLTVIPLLNFVYFYARRTTEYQAALHALVRTQNLDAALAGLSASTIESPIALKPKAEYSGFFSDILGALIQLLWARPHLSDLNMFLRRVAESEDYELSPCRYGFAFNKCKPQIVTSIDRQANV